MRKFLRFSLWLLAASLVLVVALAAYLRSADLSIYQDYIESYASRKIGHQLAIDGRFELNFGPVTRIVAEDLTLSNPEWHADPSLLKVGHIIIEFDTIEQRQVVVYQGYITEMKIAVAFPYKAFFEARP